MSEQPPYVFLTGATGFVGARVLAQLLRDLPSKPWASVTALVRTGGAAEQVRALGARPVVGDLLDLDPAVLAAIGGATYVVHCAQPSGAAALTGRPRMDLALIGALDPGRLARLVHVCGSSYFGRAEGSAPIDESTPPRPFGLGSSFAEGLAALRAAAHGGLDYAAAFVGGVYGAGSWFLDDYRRAIARGEPIAVRDPAPLWPYIHSEDCARAIEFLLTVAPERLSATGREIIVAGDEPIPMDTFVEEVYRALGAPPNLLRLSEASLRTRMPPIQATYLSANMPHASARLRALGFAWRYPTVREGLAALGLRA